MHVGRFPVAAAASMRHGERKPLVPRFMRNRPRGWDRITRIESATLGIVENWLPRLEENIGSYQPIGFVALALLDIALQSNSQTMLPALRTKLAEMERYDPGPNYRKGRDETTAMLAAIVERLASATSVKSQH